jgi:hypothetical protein
MNDTQRRRFERLARAGSFASARTADFPETSRGGQAIARLRNIVSQLEIFDTSRVANAGVSKQGTSAKQGEREALRRQLGAMTDTAETIGLDFPEVRGSFRRPRPNTNDQTLLSTARAFAAAAAPLKSRFVEYDMPDDFLEQLNASITNFEQAIVRQNSGTGARVAANASLEEALRRGEQELERLDTSVRNKFREDPATLAAWESARHIERSRRSRSNGGAQPVSTPGTDGSAQP